MVCVNLVLLRKLCKKTRCFLEKFTQLVQIITNYYTTDGRNGREKSQLWNQNLEIDQ